MPLTDHAPLTRRFVFASCSAAARSPLTATQRAAIIMALHDPQWVPSAADIPGTWAVVATWHADIERRRHPITPLLGESRTRIEYD